MPATDSPALAPAPGEQPASRPPETNPRAGTPGAPPAPAAPRRVWTSLDLLRWTQTFFQRKGIAAPRLEAELLLAGALGCERLRLYLDFEKPVPGEALALFREWVKRRAEAREPTAYILGHTQFLKLKLRVTPAVLIPRPETEELAQWAIAVAREMQRADADTDADADSDSGADPDSDDALRALDVCTGCGCLALALAARVPRLQVTATDLSAAALDVARANAAACGLSERVAFLQGDLFAALPAERRGAFALLVSNPPYVDPALKPTLAPEVREHEPAEALFAEEGGLGVLRRLAAGAGEWLRPGGRLGVEISPEQGAAVRGFLESSGAFKDIEVRRDARKCERFVTAVRVG